MTLAETIAHLSDLFSTDPVLRRFGPSIALNVMGPKGQSDAMHAGAATVVLQRVAVGTPDEAVRVQLLDSAGQVHEWRDDTLAELPRPDATPRTAAQRWKDRLATRRAAAQAATDPTDVE